MHDDDDASSNLFSLPLIVELVNRRSGRRPAGVGSGAEEFGFDADEQGAAAGDRCRKGGRESPGIDRRRARVRPDAKEREIGRAHV